MGAEMREERRVVTAMFADLVGSTALAERLGPEDTKLIVNDAVARVIGAVEAFGGTVKDLAGDGVLALFGAPTAHEDDPERAVRAALQVVEEISAYAIEVDRAFGHAGFGVRVGVDTGPVVVGSLGAGSRVEYAALGDAVNTAARLQAAAEPGTVLVGEETHRRVAPVFDWSDPRTLELKGKAGPVTAYRVEGVLAAPGYARELEAVQVRLVGRERELATAVEVVDAALAGSGGILFVTGEPGIGKTRLTAELRAHVEDAPPGPRRPLWIEGRCVSYGESMPYWPFRDLLRSWLGVLADEPELRVRLALRRRLDGLFGPRVLEVYPYLGAMLGLSLEPEARDRLAELSPEALQYRTFDVIRELLARLAADGPVVVVLEDLHWADATSLQLLERLLEDTETSALLLVLSTRPERDHPSWRLKESAARELPAPDARGRARGALGRRRPRAARRARRRRDAPAGDGAPDPRAGRGQPVLPGGAGAVARRLRGARPRGRRVAVRSRDRGRGAAHRREGDPRAHRPAATRRSRRADGGVGAGAAVRAPAARGGLRRRRRAALAP